MKLDSENCVAVDETSLQYFQHTASSYLKREWGEEYPPSLLSDNSADSFWHVADASAASWVMIDFGDNPRAINVFKALPRKDVPSHFWRDANLQASNDGISWVEVADVSMEQPPAPEKWLTWYFDNRTKYRYYRLYIMSGFRDGRFYAFAEWQMDTIDLTTMDANLISKPTHLFTTFKDKIHMRRYQHTASSYLKEKEGEGVYWPYLVSDNDTNTAWHADDKTGPSWVMIDFGDNPRAVNVLKALPRKGALSSFWRDATLQASNDGISWVEVADVSMKLQPKSAEWITWYFDNRTKHRYYRLYIKSGFYGGRFKAFAEWQMDTIDLTTIDAYLVSKPTHPSTTSAMDEKTLSKYQHKASSYLLQEGGGQYPPSLLSDGNPDTFWHAADPSGASWVMIDFGDNPRAVNVLKALPRKDELEHFWRTATLQASNNGIYWIEVADVSMEQQPKSAEWITWYFDNRTKHRYYRLYIKSGFYGGRFKAFAEWQMDTIDLTTIDAYLVSKPTHPFPTFFLASLSFASLSACIIVLLAVLVMCARWVIKAWSQKYFTQASIKEYIYWLCSGTCSSKTRRKEAVFLLLMFVCYFVLMGDVLITHKKTFRHDAVLWYGLFHYHVESLWYGFLPLWNPYMHGGEPFYYNLGTQRLLDPLTLAIIFVAKVFKPSVLELYHCYFLLSLWLVLLGIYVFCRKVLTYALSTYIVLITLLFGAMSYDMLVSNGRLFVFGWTPWIMYFFIVCLEGGSRLNFICLAYLLGLMVGTCTYHSVLISLYLLVFVCTLIINQREPLKIFLKQKPATILASILLFTCLCSPVLSLVADRDKIYAILRHPDRNVSLEGGSYIKTDLGNLAQDDVKNIVRLFVPVVKQVKYATSREGDYLLGVVPTIFLIIGILFGRHKLKTNFIILIALVALIMLGTNTFVAPLIYSVFPPLKMCREPNLLEPFLLFSIGIMIGIGVDRIVSLTQETMHEDVDKKAAEEKVYHWWSAFKNYVLSWFKSISEKTSEALAITLSAFTALQFIYIYMKGRLDYLTISTIILALILIISLLYFFIRNIKGNKYLVYPAVSTLMEKYIGLLTFTTPIFLLISAYILFTDCKFSYYILGSATVLAAVVGIILSVYAKRLNLNAATLFLLWILTITFTELQIVSGMYYQFAINTRYSSSFSTQAQKPEFKTKRTPWIGYQHDDRRWMGGQRFLSILFNENTALEEILGPKHLDDIAGPKQQDWADPNLSPYVQAYNAHHIYGQLHFTWLKSYFKIYEIGEKSVPAFHELMGLDKDDSLFDFYSRVVVMNEKDIEELFKMPYKELSPIIKSAIFVSEQLENKHDEIVTRVEDIGSPTLETEFNYEITSNNANRIGINVNVDREGALLFRDGYDNYWEAYVDGVPQKVYKANLAFKAIILPAGAHTVVFNYNPYYFLTAFKLYILSNVIFLVYVFYEVSRFTKSPNLEK